MSDTALYDCKFSMGIWSGKMFPESEAQSICKQEMHMYYIIMLKTKNDPKLATNQMSSLV